MLLTSLKIKGQRLTICRSCKHFVKLTQSCGTLGFGAEVKYKNTTKKLCGCIMPIKAHLKFSGCPIHKWKSEVSAKDIEDLNELLGEIKDGKITKSQNLKLTQLYNKITKNKRSVSSCAPCVKNMINELTDALLETNL